MNDSELTREGLFELVWTEPVRILAKRLCLSDQGLAKLCQRLKIPLPKRGHWAKVQAGHNVPRTPLPPMEDLATIRTELMRLRPTQVSARRQQVERQQVMTEISAELSVDICVDPTLQSPHVLAKKALKSLSRKTGWTDERGIRERPTEVVAIAVTETSVIRAVVLVDALFKAFEKCGIQVSVDADKATTWLKYDGESIPFTLRETVKRKLHEITATESQARERFQRNLQRGVMGHFPHVPRYDYFPTGELTIVIGHWPSKSWSDGKKFKLEDRLDEILAGALEIYAEIAERARQTAARKALHRQRLEEYTVKKARFDAETTALKKLEAEAARWQRAEALRRYTEAVEAQALASNRLTPELADWLSWAKIKAEWLDPRQQISDVILDAPMPPDPGPVW